MSRPVGKSATTIAVALMAGLTSGWGWLIVGDTQVWGSPKLPTKRR